MNGRNDIVINSRGETVDVDLDEYLQVPNELLPGWEMTPLADLYAFTGLSIHASGTPPVWLYQFITYHFNEGAAT